MMKLRNRMIKLFALGLLLAILAGCGEGNWNEVANHSAETSVAASSETSNESEPVPAENQRIVSTTVAVTQIMDRLDIDLVGVPKSVKTLPARYDQAVKVGNPMSPDMELVKSLQPTEVLSVTTLQYELEPVFKQAKVNAEFLDLTSLESMQKEILKLGEKFDRQEQAKQLVEEYEQALKELQQATAGKEKPTVLILLGVPGSYLVATEHSYIGDLVRLAGGVNIVQGEKVEYLASNTEYLHQSNPDVILRAAHGMPEEVVKMFDEEFRKNDIWHHFKAVQTGRVYDLEERLFGTTGNLAVSESLKALLPMLYPDIS
ncbi:heme ABC transporter substrate-binding protein IsdE [Paenibacillus sp. HB172176]|uniref:heme ABC transporter substrate-binding protein IsdE n=1 Tax=Paenibacillus sp. HB172176 TaxID=2493690 RepID=UPI001438D574|nr:heme ABC transporter substrate-binding protein IsdE [Paenibacillus sp. HB172176]